MLVGRRLGTIVISNLAVAALSVGCSGDSSPSAGEPEPTESATVSDPAPSDSLSATASAPPSVAAGMKEITSVEGFTVQIPKTYRLSIDEKDGFNSRDTVDDFRELAMSAIPVASGADPLAETRGYFYSDNGFLIRPKTLKPVTVAGVKMFHVAGMIDSVAWLEGFGVQTEDYVYQIKFIFQERTTPAKERRAVVESVLSTMELR